jgi:hypothetical protein
MPQLNKLALIGFIMFCATSSLAQVNNKITPKATVANNEIRLELLQMLKEDQEVLYSIDTEEKERQLIPQLNTVLRHNINRLKAIIKEYGWPGKTLVGTDGAESDFYIAQHADMGLHMSNSAGEIKNILPADIEFQKECLALLKAASDKGEAEKQHWAYLTDRVLVNEGKKQIYGTQFEVVNGELKFFPMENEANVDLRRKEVGLIPVEEYRQQFESLKKQSTK